ncbi:MAG: aminoglycoside phosphotransferase family protein [Cyanobacteriota bacterium]|nr:aminoglycoside phosphotransferase family protein [Cyanobacteriota bacterium]
MLDNIARHFADSKKGVEVRPLGSGNINDTFLVTLDALTPTQFVLQCLNTRVFRQPQWVVQNIRIATDQARAHLQTSPIDRRWEVPHLLLTDEGMDYYIDADGSFWRAMSFIDNTESFEILDCCDRAVEVGYALGTFHSLIADIPPEHLADTLEGFHIAPLYWQNYKSTLAGSKPQNTPEVKYCLQFVRDRSSLTGVLEGAKKQGKLPLRPIHGDPKINNILFDIETGRAASLIDLDTVKPGLIQYDLGDCLRSGCNRGGEETKEWENVSFDLELCQGILKGYLGVAGSFLTENDYAYLYDAARLIAFELGLRFFTDYLAGNVYFKVQYPEHNLARALVQFKLTESIELQEQKIREIIKTFQ